MTVKLPKKKKKKKAQEIFMKEGIDQTPLHSRYNHETENYLSTGNKRQLNDISNDLNMAQRTEDLNSVPSPIKVTIACDSKPSDLMSCSGFSVCGAHKLMHTHLHM